MAITGTGTQNDPYMVDSVAALLQKVQESGVYIKITKDLDCYKEDTPWQSVEWISKSVDGQNHKIGNIYASRECMSFNNPNCSIANIEFDITCDYLNNSTALFNMDNYWARENSINSCKINLTLENTLNDIIVFNIQRERNSLNNNKIKVMLKGMNKSLLLLNLYDNNIHIQNLEFLIYPYDNGASIDEINMIYSTYSGNYVERCRFRIEVPECKKFHIFREYSSGCQISSSYFIGNIGTEEALFKDTRGYTIVNSYIALKNHKSKVNISTNIPTNDRTTAYNAINTFINAEDTNIAPVGSFIGLTEAQCKDPDYLNSIRWYVK